jgi:vacuolar protein sorting-associated protein 35
MMLSNIARLNPHVDMKKIVIGLMDRLSSYAVKDTETTNDPAKRKEDEEAAVARLLENLKVTEKQEPATGEATAAKSDPSQENGTKPDDVAQTPAEASKTTEVTVEDSSSSSSDIKLYEIFYAQVLNLIKTRGLAVQDAIALLVSLVNLAL